MAARLQFLHIWQLRHLHDARSSCPTQENLSLARQVIKYIIGSFDLKITYRPDDPNDPLSEINNGLIIFTDSDWATSADTWCYVIMFAGAAIAHRSKSHKSVMLSSAAAEYYEASEGCLELAYIRGNLKDFYGAECPSTPTYIDNCLNLRVFIKE